MVGAARELRELVKGFDEDQLREFCAEKALNGSSQPQHHRIRMDVLKHSSRRVKRCSQRGRWGASFGVIRIVHVSA